MKLLVANRGEIAIRIMRAAAELHIPTVAVAPPDDAGALHTGKADEAVSLDGTGTAAYLDLEQLIAVARAAGCDAVHPGYGFLAENADFARRCAEEGLTFIGPPRGHRGAVRGQGPAPGWRRRRRRCRSSGASTHAVSPAEAAAFFDALGGGRGMILKAVGGGGGRGSRVVERADAVASTYERCRAEAQAAFGNGALYVEEFLPQGAPCGGPDSGRHPRCDCPPRRA